MSGQRDIPKNHRQSRCLIRYLTCLRTRDSSSDPTVPNGTNNEKDPVVQRQRHLRDMQGPTGIHAIRCPLVQFQPGSLEWFWKLVCRCSGSTRLWYGRSSGSTPERTSKGERKLQNETRAAGPTGRRLVCTQEDQLASMPVGARFNSPTGPLTDDRWAHGPTGRHRYGMAGIRVRFPVGPLYGRQPDIGSPELSAKQCAT
jgi:hypothetical protein